MINYKNFKIITLVVTFSVFLFSQEEKKIDKGPLFKYKFGTFYQLNMSGLSASSTYFRAVTGFNLSSGPVSVNNEIYLVTVLGPGTTSVRVQDVSFTVADKGISFRTGLGFDKATYGSYYKPLYAGVRSFLGPWIPFSGISLGIAPVGIPLSFIMGLDLTMVGGPLLLDDVFVHLVLALKDNPDFLLGARLEYWLSGGTLKQLSTIKHFMLLGVDVTIAKLLNVFVTLSTRDLIYNNENSELTIGVKGVNLGKILSEITFEVNAPLGGYVGMYLDTKFTFGLVQAVLFFQQDIKTGDLFKYGFRLGAAFGGSNKS